MRRMAALLTGLTSFAAVAGLDNPAADMDLLESGGSILPALLLLAMVAGVVKAWSESELGGWLVDIAKGLAWLAGMYLWIFVFGACVFAWLYIFRSLFDSKEIAGLSALICGAATGWRIFRFVVERAHKRQ